MKDRITIDGYEFENCKDYEMYQCRGEMCYDDEHDEVPERGLWQAALILEKQLIEEGKDASRSHSEKGWVEVSY